MAKPKYEVTAVAFDPHDRIVVNEFSDTQGRRTEVIDPNTNSLFADVTGPWDVEDRYEAFWNRLNDSWERNFPTYKDRVKVLRVREIK